MGLPEIRPDYSLHTLEYTKFLPHPHILLMCDICPRWPCLDRKDMNMKGFRKMVFRENESNTGLFGFEIIDKPWKTKLLMISFCSHMIS